MPLMSASDLSYANSPLKQGTSNTEIQDSVFESLFERHLMYKVNHTSKWLLKCFQTDEGPVVQN